MKSNGWRFFFVFLLLAGLAAGLIPVLFNRERQLSLVEIEKSKLLWAKSGPLDYTLLVRLKEQAMSLGGVKTEPMTDRLKLRFRQGQLVEASKNGAFIPVKEAIGWNGPALFERLETYLLGLQPRDYLTVDFNPLNGHPMRWVRVNRRGENAGREEVDLVLVPKGEERPNAAGNDQETQAHTGE